jgi:hypothetical protein
MKNLAPLQIKLNEKIKLAAMKTAVNYVEPNTGSSSFVGHDVCAQVPWVNQVNLGHKKYSFHPNGLGQAALATVVQSAITSTHATNPVQPPAPSRGVFLIPAGRTAKISNATWQGACDSLTYGYQVNGGAAIQVDSWTGHCQQSAAAANASIGPFSTPMNLRIWLRDTQCTRQPHGPSSWRYFSDGNHALVSGTGPWTLDIQDSLFCFFDITSSLVPKRGNGNLNLTLSIS